MIAMANSSFDGDADNCNGVDDGTCSYASTDSTVMTMTITVDCNGDEEQEHRQWINGTNINSSSNSNNRNTVSNSINNSINNVVVVVAFDVFVAGGKLGLGVVDDGGGDVVTVGGRCYQSRWC